MAIPPFLEFAKMQTERSQQRQDPMGAITGALEEVVKGRREKEQAAVAKQYGEARLEEQQLKADKERQLIAKQKQDMEHARLLAPYQRNLVKAKVEKEKVPLEELASLNYHQKQARDAGDTKTADLYKGMMHDYAATHYKQADAAKIRGLVDQRDEFREQGKEQEAANLDKVISGLQEQKLSEPEKLKMTQDLKDLSAYTKSATDDSRMAHDTIKEVNNFVRHYKDTNRLFKGGKLRLPLSGITKGAAWVLSDNYKEMNKAVGNLQQAMIGKLKPGRLAKHVQDLVASSTLDPSLGLEGVENVSRELRSAAQQLGLRSQFIDAAKEKGVFDPAKIDAAWTRYVNEKPVLADKATKIRNMKVYEDIPENLDKSVWGKYVPKAKPSYTDTQIDFAAKNKGISREEVIRRLKAAGRM